MSISTLHIRREPPSQRRYYRLAVPLIVTIGTQNYKTMDWSLGGFALANFAQSIAPGQEIIAAIAINFQGFHVTFDTKIRILRADPSAGTMGAAFIGLDAKGAELLQHFSDGLISGTMKSVNDTIRRIDIPVTPVSEKPDSPYVDGRKKSWRRFAIGGIYLALGIGLGYYALTSVYATAFRLRVDTAALTVPGQDALSTTTGTIEQVYYQDGDIVEAGTPLVRIRDDQITEPIEMARIEIMDARADLDDKRAKLKAQRDKLQSYKRIGIDKAEAKRAAIESLKKRLAFSENRAATLRESYTRGGVSNYLVQEAEQRVASDRAELESAQSELQMAERDVVDTTNGRFYTNHRFEGEVAELSSVVKYAEQRVTLLEEKLAVLRRRETGLTVNAPVSGRISRLHVVSGGTIDRGMPVAFIETPGARSVEVFLTQQQLDEVAVGQHADVFVPTRQETITARVAAINIDATTNGDEKRQHIAHGHGPLLPVARAQLALDTPDERASAFHMLAGGTPLIVEFHRSSTAPSSSPLRGIASLFSPASATEEDHHDEQPAH